MDLNSSFNSLPTGPFDSPAEERFLHHLTKALAADASYDDHVPVDTLCGPFVIDYVVSVATRRVGFEIDGREFHDAERDVWRDAAILASGVVDAMIHIRASDLYRYPYDTLCLISRAEGALFSERGRSVLERLAHRAVRRIEVDPNGEYLGAVIWRQEDELESEDLDEEVAEECDDDISPTERAERREERRVWDRILADEMRYGPQAPHCISVSRRGPGGRLRPLIECVRRFGPASLADVRKEAERLG